MIKLSEKRGKLSLEIALEALNSLDSLESLYGEFPTTVYKGDIFFNLQTRKFTLLQPEVLKYILVGKLSKRVFHMINRRAVTGLEVKKLEALELLTKEIKSCLTTGIENIFTSSEMEEYDCAKYVRNSLEISAITPSDILFIAGRNSVVFQKELILWFEEKFFERLNSYCKLTGCRPNGDTISTAADILLDLYQVEGANTETKTGSTISNRLLKLLDYAEEHSLESLSSLSDKILGNEWFLRDLERVITNCSQSAHSYNEHLFYFGERVLKNLNYSQPITKELYEKAFEKSINLHTPAGEKAKLSKDWVSALYSFKKSGLLELSILNKFLLPLSTFSNLDTNQIVLPAGTNLYLEDDLCQFLFKTHGNVSFHLDVPFKALLKLTSENKVNIYGSEGLKMSLRLLLQLYEQGFPTAKVYDLPSSIFEDEERYSKIKLLVNNIITDFGGKKVIRSQTIWS